MADKRQKFDAEFREGAVRIGVETGKTLAEVARDLEIWRSGDLEIWRSTRRRWRPGSRGPGKPAASGPGRVRNWRDCAGRTLN
ncbi:transposase [Kitasatospora kazusensis]|uniref:transposase n=1 Tax=Kitasatospora kazusensis TaxID=407974 RepID=UPI0031D359BB